MVVSGLRAVDKSWGCGDMLVLVLGSWQGLWLYFGVLPPNFTQGDGAVGRGDAHSLSPLCFVLALDPALC